MSSHDVHVFRESIAKIVRALTDSKIPVLQRGSDAYVDFDSQGKPERVVLPALPDNAPADLMNAIQGFLDHEVAHVLETDFTYSYKMNREYEKVHDRVTPALWNIVEDVRIEDRMTKRFAGSRMNLDNVQRYIAFRTIQKAYDEMVAKGEPSKKLRSLLLPSAIRAVSGQDPFVQFMRDKWHAMGDWEAPIRAIASKLKALPSTKAAWDLAAELKAQIAKSEEPPAPPPPAPSSPPPPKEKGSKGNKGDSKGEQGDKPEKENKNKDDADESGDEKGSSPSENPNPEPNEGEDESEEESEGKGESEGEESDDDAEEEEEEGEGEKEKGESDSEDEEESDEEEEGEGSGGSDGDPDPDGDGDDENDDPDGDDVEVESAGGGIGGEMASLDDEAIDPEMVKSMEDFAMQAIGDGLSEVVKDADYMPFSRDLDYVGPHPCAELWQQQPLEKSRVAKMADESCHVIQSEVERVFKARSAARWNPGQRKGKLARNSLHRIRLGDDRVFRTKIEAQNRDIAVSLVIDCSGSMSGYKIQAACTAAFMLAKVLERINVSLEILGFTTMYQPINKDHASRKDWKDYNDAMHSAASRSHGKGAITYGRYAPLALYVFKDFLTRFTHKEQQVLAGMGDSGSYMYNNVDGESIELAARRLYQRKEARKIMIVLSDGQPASDGPCALGRAKLKSVIRMSEASGIEVYGLGLMDNAVRSYYDKCEVIERSEEIPAKVISLAQRLLT